MVTGRPMFPGSTVKEELHLIFRLLGESSAVSQIPTRGQWLTAGAVAKRSLRSLEGAQPLGKALQWRGQAWAGVGKSGQAWAAAACSLPPGLQSSRGVRTRSSSPAAPWDAQANPSLPGIFVPSLSWAGFWHSLFSLHQMRMTGFPLSPSQEPQQKTPGLE